LECIRVCYLSEQGMTNKHKRKYVLPSAGVSFQEQLLDCVGQIDEIKKDNNILQLTFFIRSGNNIDYAGKKKAIVRLLHKHLGRDIPSASVVGQIPDNKELSVELVYLSKSIKHIRIRHKIIAGVCYTLVESDAEKAIFAGGISSDEFLDHQRSVQAEAAFSIMDRILRQESMTFADIIRQWNYVEDIVGYNNQPENKIQNYQALNDVRSKYYATAQFVHGYPAATGIGMNSGGIILEFYANKPYVTEEIIPIKNPQQKDAYDYSQQVLVGNSLPIQTKKTSPKFERAKYISAENDKIIFVSGTASIKGEVTLGIGDVATQTKTTIENIRNLISHENLGTNQILNNYNALLFSSIRVYVKIPSDMEKVREICDASFPEVQINYLVADICRDALLVEIEGIAELTS
jgi:enamine deaminase RidA (YjgF/YER057c/UK114 family)